MSKKQKRRVSSGSSSVTRATPSAASTPVTTTASAQARMRSQIFEFKPDYTYIKNDLRRISIIAASFLVVLVILSFIVPLIFH